MWCGLGFACHPAHHRLTCKTDNVVCCGCPGCCQVLAQEIDRIAKVIGLTRNTLKDLKLAVAGTIIMGEHLVECLNSLYDARAPPRWVKISWCVTRDSNSRYHPNCFA